MSRRLWATYLWPGLPQVCGHGSWSGLAVAIGFAGLLNLGLAASLVWCELLTPGVRTVVWTTILAIWGGSLVFSSRADRRNALREEAPQPNDTFAKAIDLYLKGSWFEAESVLVDLLRRNPRDVDAGLMLATLLRHTGRCDEAAAHLDRLDRIESSVKWYWEIQGERQRLSEPVAQDDDAADTVVVESSAAAPSCVEKAA